MTTNKLDLEALDHRIRADKMQAALTRLVEREPHRGESAECVFCGGGGCGNSDHNSGCPWVEAVLILTVQRIHDAGKPEES